MSTLTPMTAEDDLAFQREMGRPARGVLGVAYRCAHGIPAVVQTAPRLPDGTPFPTLYYLCCSELNATISRMESAGIMAQMTAVLAEDPTLSQAYRAAHQSYLTERNALGELGIDVTAGGMPDRVKCLHALAAHSLAVGRGINPIGDQAVDRLSEFADQRPCARLA